MKILKTLLLIPFLMFGKSALADTTISLGAGVQHGGLMGGQVAQFFGDDNKQKVRGALGVIGGAVGYDYMVTRNISFGGSIYYYNILSNYRGTALHANYYFNPANNNGFWVGVDVLNETETGWKTGNETEEVKTNFSVGYRF